MAACFCHLHHVAANSTGSPCYGNPHAANLMPGRGRCVSGWMDAMPKPRQWVAVGLLLSNAKFPCLGPCLCPCLCLCEARCQAPGPMAEARGRAGGYLRNHAVPPPPPPALACCRAQTPAAAAFCFRPLAHQCAVEGSRTGEDCLKISQGPAGPIHRFPWAGPTSGLETADSERYFRYSALLGW